MKPFIPEMIFFDYGGTLMDEGRFDEVAAARAILSCADNPRAASEETVLALWREARADRPPHSCRRNRTRNSADADAARRYGPGRAENLALAAGN